MAEVKHSKNFEKINGYYKSGAWSIDRVWSVVGKSLGITEEEYKEITGFTYPDKGKDGKTGDN